MALDISKLRNTNVDLDNYQISTLGLDISKKRNSVGDLDM